MLRIEEFLISDTPGTLRLIELGKIYLDLGYLKKSLQVHRRVLDIAKESDSGKAAHQVNLRESVDSEVAM